MRVEGLPPLPAGRACALCGGPTRFSHTTYVGRGGSVAVHVCRDCGSAYRSRMHDAMEAYATEPGSRVRPRARGARARPLPDEGPPSNPVIDAATAERLCELLGD